MLTYAVLPYADVCCRPPSIQDAWQARVLAQSKYRASRRLLAKRASIELEYAYYRASRRLLALEYAYYRASRRLLASKQAPT
jgi:hypothetical protein